MLAAAERSATAEAARFEQRRVDPLRKLRRLVQRLLYVTAHLVQERSRGCRIGHDQFARELEVDRERHEVLLHAVVQFALDATAIVVGRKHEPPA